MFNVQMSSSAITLLTSFYILLKIEATVYVEVHEHTKTGYGLIDRAILYGCYKRTSKIDGRMMTYVTCLSVPQADKATVYSYANFYDTTAAVILPDHVIMLDGTELARDTYGWCVGFSPKAPGLPEQLFEMESHDRTAHSSLMQKLSDLMAPYIQKSEGKLISDLAHLYEINDVRAFVNEPDRTTLVLSFVTALEKVMKDAAGGKKSRFKNPFKGKWKKWSKKWKWRKKSRKDSKSASPEKHLRSVISFLLLKMFDPCAILTHSKNAEHVGRISPCTTYCRFLGLSAKVLALKTHEECRNFEVGICTDSVCRCFRRRSRAARLIGKKYHPGVNMAQCNNALRHQATSDMVEGTRS